MTDLPPALTARPQFTPEHWAKVSRSNHVQHIERVTRINDGTVEIHTKEGMFFRRKKSEIKQLLTRNLEVHVETIDSKAGQMVTGLFVPNIGWAFRMSNGDLAEHTKTVAQQVHDHQSKLRQAMCQFLAIHIEQHLMGKGLTVPVIASLDAMEMAHKLMAAMETGPK